MRFSTRLLGELFWAPRFTFKAQHLTHRQTLPKFTLVAGLGFFNESFLLLSNLYFNVPVSTLVCTAIVLTSMVTFYLTVFAFQH